MSALTTQQRAEVTALYHATIPVGETHSAVLKADIKAAFDAVDDWVVANATAFNNALPAAAKTNLTAAQKARLLQLVVAKRYQVGA